MSLPLMSIPLQTIPLMIPSLDYPSTDAVELQRASPDQPASHQIPDEQPLNLQKKTFFF